MTPGFVPAPCWVGRASLFNPHFQRTPTETPTCLPKHLPVSLLTRSDVLLYRCLPRAVAPQLREGASVEATVHEQLTVMFSE